MSDLQNVAEENKCEPVQIANNSPLGCLLWADDLLLLSRSEAGLKNMLNGLKSYTEENGITLNIKKTKVMIFNKSGRHIRRNIYFGRDKIESTRQYKYLGFLVTPSGEITTGLKDLKDRALRAFAKMKKKQGLLFRKYPHITMKLFKALVEPILLYASDFWGILKLPKNNPIENVHLSFCKQLLGVQKQTTNIGVLLELGQVPLNILAQKNAIKNWSRIVNNIKCNELLKTSHENAIMVNLTWPKRIESRIAEIGMWELFLRKDKAVHVRALVRMRDIFHQEAFAEIQNDNSKLKTYSHLKSSIGYEEYLSKIGNIQERTSFSKIRMSNHPLLIEKGRHEKIERNQRFCPFCPKLVEDETHFVLECTCFSKLRVGLIDKISQENPSFQYLSKTEKFVVLMTDISIVTSTAQFIHRALDVRKFLLEKHKNQI